MHIELIEPAEKLAPPLGSGYLPPQKEPADAGQLLADANRRMIEVLNTCVWKVARRSVGWHQGKYRASRWLTVNGRRRIRGKVLGGQRDWYFVAVCASDAWKALQ